MKFIFSIELVCLLALSCKNYEIAENELDPGISSVIEGCIFEISDSRILVVDGISKEDSIVLTEIDLFGPDRAAGNVVGLL
ncbi:hypothetical protein J2S74_003052 [Evansella vedderi]|uniref:Uncharacterized protein n=1 Tax=Evansella vedderi TaxID=38282 RepID=A0ABU0A007_9BACI|nr:hypothetical protein [Evansella vedderi]MDQ0255670.1 hypothetical protein [Evansella vedderi]